MGSLPYYVEKDVRRGLRSMMSNISSEDYYDPAQRIEWTETLDGRRITLIIEPAPRVSHRPSAAFHNTATHGPDER